MEVKPCFFKKDGAFTAGSYWFSYIFVSFLNCGWSVTSNWGDIKGFQSDVIPLQCSMDGTDVNGVDAGENFVVDYYLLLNLF